VKPPAPDGSASSERSWLIQCLQSAAGSRFCCPRASFDRLSPARDRCSSGAAINSMTTASYWWFAESVATK